MASVMRPAFGRDLERALGELQETQRIVHPAPRDTA